LCSDGVTQGSMLRPLLLNNYNYAERLGLQGEVSVATQGAGLCSDLITDYLRISAPVKNVARRIRQAELLCTIYNILRQSIKKKSATLSRFFAFYGFC